LPIVTNTATTTVAVLGSTDFDFPEHFSLCPNPAAYLVKVISDKGSSAARFIKQ
jgi:hypothetical protein